MNSLYLHFPFCRHLCNYCDFFKTIVDPKGVGDFHEYLEKSWEVNQELLKENQYEWSKLKTLYIGGGTPSLWGEEGAFYLDSFFKKRKIEFEEGGEFTMEVNPGAISEKGLCAWQEVGINRFSVGIQSLNPVFLKLLDRVHSIKDSLDCLKMFESKGLNFSVDLMLGLPFSVEKKRDVIEELKQMMDFNPSHLSLYILTTKGNYLHQKNLPDEEFIEEEYLKVCEFLKDYGLLHYEVSNFAREGLESVHNLNYWNSHSVAALGPSATGYLAEAGLRYKWKVSGASFATEKLNDEEISLEKMYLGLRTNRGIFLDDHFANEKAKLEFLKLTESWKDRGLVQTSNNNNLTLNSNGLLVLDGLLNEFFSLKVE